MSLRYLSVCSGIEAASVAWKPLGWQCAGLSEIEEFPRAVLEHRQGAQAVDWDHRHSPQSNLLPLFGDFTQIESHHVGPIDLLVGGTPCQSFSIAGLRGGLDDDRGNLALEFLRLADRTRPRWLVWENVPGVLSSLSHAAPDPCEPPPPLDLGCDGAEVVTTDDYHSEELHSFECFLAGLQELGYGFAYRVLDAQYAGLAQRRRRVFVVGHLGNWQRAAAVLFERHSLSGHPAPRREKGKEVAGTLESRASGGGGGPGAGTDGAAAGYLQPVDWPADVAPTLNAAFGEKLGLEDQHIRGGGGLFVPAGGDVPQRRGDGPQGRRDGDADSYHRSRLR